MQPWPVSAPPPSPTPRCTLQVEFEKPVDAKGNIEVWLQRLVDGMQDTVKQTIKRAVRNVYVSERAGGRLRRARGGGGFRILPWDPGLHGLCLPSPVFNPRDRGACPGPKRPRAAGGGAGFMV
jgi:hypothetical protein